MAGWDGLWINKAREAGNETNQTGTKNIQKGSRQKIAENFEWITDELLKNSLIFLAEKNSTVKKIMEILELKNIKINEIKIEKGHLTMNLSVYYEGNLRKLVLQHFPTGFKNNVHGDKDWVNIYSHMYWSFMAISITQEHLSK